LAIIGRERWGGSPSTPCDTSIRSGRSSSWSLASAGGSRSRWTPTRCVPDGSAW